MSCCSKANQFIGQAAEKAAHIAEGFARLAITEPLGITEYYEFTDDRIRACQKCEHNTWLTPAEYLAFAAAHGVDFAKNIADLTVLPELSKYGPEHATALYCRLCKCFIPAKARVKAENCPLNLWPPVK